MHRYFACAVRLLIAVGIFTCALAAQQSFFLRDHDVVVFYGDSITDQRLYTTFVETFVVTRYPQMPVRFVHSGWGGDRVSGGGGGPIDLRLQRDVIAYKPTVMTIMLGMNDGRYRAFDEGVFKEFATGYEHILQVMKEAAPGIRITPIRPSPYDDVTYEPRFPGGYNSVLVRYGEFIQQLAQKNQMTVADLNASVVAALAKAKATDAALAQRIIPDRVHPGAAGHLLMAAALLRAWGTTPLVTSVEIDAGAARVGRVENTEIRDLSVAPRLSWTQRDKALPMPVNMKDPTVALAVRSSDFVETLNQQTLKVSGLRAGNYTLQINATRVGSFSADRLAAGINLAELETPMAKQSAAVHELTLKRTGVHQMRWRQLQLPFRDDNIPRIASVDDNLRALEEDLSALQRTAAQPAATFYELIPE